MNTHGIGQANLVPFVTGVRDFITIKINDNLVLFRFGVFTRNQVCDSS
ncbi:Uncharacterised protein [Streptococcus pneumoniae]|nr:Uncharacterised protein [Streptococcus pneumoniae]